VSQIMLDDAYQPLWHNDKLLDGVMPI